MVPQAKLKSMKSLRKMNRRKKRSVPSPFIKPSFAWLLKDNITCSLLMRRALFVFGISIAKWCSRRKQRLARDSWQLFVSILSREDSLPVEVLMARFMFTNLLKLPTYQRNLWKIRRSSWLVRATSSVAINQSWPALDFWVKTTLLVDQMTRWFFYGTLRNQVDIWWSTQTTVLRSIASTFSIEMAIFSHLGLMMLL